MRRQDSQTQRALVTLATHVIAMSAKVVVEFIDIRMDLSKGRADGMELGKRMLLSNVVASEWTDENQCKFHNNLHVEVVQDSSMSVNECHDVARMLETINRYRPSGNII